MPTETTTESTSPDVGQGPMDIGIQNTNDWLEREAKIEMDRIKMLNGALDMIFGKLSKY